VGQDSDWRELPEIVQDSESKKREACVEKGSEPGGKTRTQRGVIELRGNCRTEKEKRQEDGVLASLRRWRNSNEGAVNAHGEKRPVSRPGGGKSWIRGGGSQTLAEKTINARGGGPVPSQRRAILGKDTVKIRIKPEVKKSSQGRETLLKSKGS